MDAHAIFETSQKISQEKGAIKLKERLYKVAFFFLFKTEIVLMN